MRTGGQKSSWTSTIIRAGLKFDAAIFGFLAGIQVDLRFVVLGAVYTSISWRPSAIEAGEAPKVKGGVGRVSKKCKRRKGVFSKRHHLHFQRQVVPQL